jgi:protein-disulfide isomerase
MHDHLYKNQNAWSKAADVAPVFAEYSGAIGLDVARFRNDYASPQLRVRINADQERGASLGVKSTPTIFINGNPLPPTSLNEAGLRAAIEAALRGEKPPTPSPTPMKPSPTAPPVPAPAISPQP